MLFLRCAFHGRNQSTCQQKRTYSVDDVREDSKLSCADPNRPLRVLLDLTVTIKDNKKYTIKDNIFCCNNKIKGKTALGSFLAHCCGTQFAVCDDFSHRETYKKLANKKKYSPNLLQCCGQRANNRYTYHCTPVTHVTDYMYTEMNARYMAKKTGKPKSEFADAPLVERDGFGLCSYSVSGRWDITKDLMQDVGVDIWAKCKEGKAGKNDKGDAKNLKCSDTGDKKFLYQYKRHANICCNKGSMMHRTVEEIKAGCCVHNHVTEYETVPRQVPFLRAWAHEPCSDLSCCREPCGKVNTNSNCQDTDKYYCAVKDRRCSSSKPNETFADCFEHYDVFHPIDWMAVTPSQLKTVMT